MVDVVEVGPLPVLSARMSEPDATLTLEVLLSINRSLKPLARTDLIGGMIMLKIHVPHCPIIEWQT